MADNEDYYDDIEEELEDEEDEDGMSEAERLQFEMEEKILKNKLKATFVKVLQSGKSKLSSVEKKDMNKAKQHPNLKGDINRINLILGVNKAKLAYKLMASSPALGYVCIGVLILFLVIAAIAAIGSIMPWLFPKDENNDGTVNAANGITGVDFYGARMVYGDNDKATKAIVEDYVEFVENGILEVEQITSVVAENGGSSFNVELTVNLTMPDEKFDYSNFDETNFSSNYSELYAIVYDIAKMVYKIDNGVDFNGVSLVQCVDGIKYFGYGDVAGISSMVTEAIVNKVTYVSSNDTEGKLTINDISDTARNKLQTYYSTYSTARTEKLFVKDYILQGENMMSDIKKENYVAMIFMARKNVVFTKLSFAVGNADLTNFVISVNGQPMSTDGDNLGDDKNQSYIYSETGIISCGKFPDIDENNLGALSNEMSLYDIANLTNYSTYLMQTTSQGENPTNYLTVKKNGVVVNLFNTEAFNIVEFETTWQAAS